MKVAGQTEEIHTFVYDLPLLNEKQEVVMFQVYGIDRISTSVQQINITEVIGLFQGLNAKEVKRPVGEIDVLIGFEYAGFHPIRVWMKFLKNS